MFSVSLLSGNTRGTNKGEEEEESQAAIDVTGLATGVNASGCLVADWPLGFVLDTPLVRRGQGRAYISPL